MFILFQPLIFPLILIHILKVITILYTKPIQMSGSIPFMQPEKVRKVSLTYLFNLVIYLIDLFL